MNLKIKKLNIWNKIAFIAVGFIAFAWFVIRVVPKPSRATYPCQRAAFPFATAFVIWLTGVFTSIFSFNKAKEHIKRTKYVIAVSFLAIATLSFIVAWILAPQLNLSAEPLLQNIEPAPLLINQKGISNENFSTPISYVSIVKSDKENSADIAYNEIEAMIREAVNKTDDFRNLIRDNISVVIKPNIVSNTDWSNSKKQVPAENNGMVTDWRVIKAIVKLVRDYNPNGQVYIVEGSADNTTRTNMASLNYSLENFPGVTDIIYLEEHSGNWEEWNSEKMVQVEIPANKALYANSLKPNKTNAFYLNKIYYESDVLISVPVLKNHSMTSVTGAVKNVGIGATPQNIYGGAKGNNHRYVNNRIDHSNYTNLHKFIHDFYLCRPVDYAIMEGLQGNENGPVAEKAANLSSIQKNMRLILAGSDPLAVDAIASLIMRYDPSKVNHLAYLHNDTIGCIDPKYIRVLGPNVNSIAKSFNHWAQTSPKFNDELPPEVNISHFSITNNLLKLSINSIQPNDILKVEFEIDNQKNATDVIAGFDNIDIDLSKFTLTDTLVKIEILDKYLNCKTVYYKGEGLITKKDKLFGQNIHIFPNPAIDRLYYNFDNNKVEKVELLNISGALVQTLHFTKTEIFVEREQIPPGNYILKFITANGNLAKKIALN